VLIHVRRGVLLAVDNRVLREVIVVGNRAVRSEVLTAATIKDWWASDMCKS